MAISVLRQAGLAIRVMAYGLRRRLWSAANAALGAGVVVGVLVAVLSIGAGYQDTMRLQGAGHDLLVLRAGAESEMQSSLTGDQVGLIAGAAGPLAGTGGTVSPEVFAVANGQAPDGRPMNIAVRGIVPGAMTHQGVQIVAGRMFHPGTREIVVGRMAQRRFAGLAIGGQFAFGGDHWTVVGSFTAGGTVAESEIRTDATLLQAAYRRGDSYQLVLVHPTVPLDAATLAAALHGDPRLDVSVRSLTDYYAEQGRQMQGFVRVIGYGVCALMSVGAIFASLNTGFSQVKACARELATLAALGWSQRALIGAIAAESLATSLLGAVAGALVVRAAFNGSVISSLFYSKEFSQVVFAFHVDAGVLLQGACAAIGIGLVGAMAPIFAVRRLAISRILTDRR